MDECYFQALISNWGNLFKSQNYVIQQFYNHDRAFVQSDHKHQPLSSIQFDHFDVTKKIIQRCKLKAARDKYNWNANVRYFIITYVIFHLKDQVIKDGFYEDIIEYPSNIQLLCEN